MTADAAPSFAKVNLYLHVTGQRPDGLHLLDSLVVFPAIGDFIEVEASTTLSLTLDGPQGFALDGGAENLVLRAALALRENFRLPEGCGASILLDKRLPIAGGVGGGSANAATTLKLLNVLWNLGASEERLAEIGLSLGADVPVCLAAPNPRYMRGIGEALAPPPRLPPFWLTLVNPGVPVATGSVFRALQGRFGSPPPPPPPELSDFGVLVDWLGAARNDLEPAAAAMVPEISVALAALRSASGCALARMSGSGGTCFGLFEDGEAAMQAAAQISSTHAGWWTAAGPVDGGR